MPLPASTGPKKKIAAQADEASAKVAADKMAEEDVADVKKPVFKTVLRPGEI